MTVHLNKLFSSTFFDGENCPICLVSFADNSALGHSFEGGFHAFHDECIKEHIASNPRCPCCIKDFANVLAWIPQDNIDRAQGLQLLTFVETNELELAVELLATGLITPHYRGLATVEAALRQDGDFTSALLNRTISLEHRGQAFVAAIEKEHLDIAEALFADGAIDPTSIDSAFLWASDSANEALLAFLLERFPLESHLRGLCIIHAADHENFSATYRLLAEGIISRSHRGQALIKASVWGNIDLVSLLLAQEILPSHLQEAFF